MTYSDCPL